MRIAVLLLAACFLSVAHAGDKIEPWQPIVWNGERALVSTASGWKAIVSLERGRLVHFGPSDAETNLLFAPATRHDPLGWGGHRIWLGPQRTWPGGWPPPAAWERSGPESFTNADGKLCLILPDAGQGWPRLTRTYHWSGARLLCGVELSGGTRDAQIIQIVQIPDSAQVDAVPKPSKVAPRGYVQLPSVVTPEFTANFTLPPHVTPTSAGLTLRHLNSVQKLGFSPQTLTAHQKSFSLAVGRVEPSGRVVNEPDSGFFTQVYLGGNEAFIELEQLTPTFSPKAPASFTISIEGSSP
jgi:hypothetical protein